MTVNADSVNEPAETFFLNLSNESSGTMVDGQAVATIADGTPPPPPPPPPPHRLRHRRPSATTAATATTAASATAAASGRPLPSPESDRPASTDGAEPNQQG